MDNENVQQEPQRDMLLFHDMVALAARVEDEALRCRALIHGSGVDARMARSAGMVYALLDRLEGDLFKITNTIHHQAREVGLDASPAMDWHGQKEACREARQMAHDSAKRLGPVSDGAVGG